MAQEVDGLLAQVHTRLADRREVLDSSAQFFRFKKDVNAMVLLFEDKLGAVINSALGDDVDQTTACIKRLDHLDETINSQDPAFEELSAAGAAVTTRNAAHGDSVAVLMGEVEHAREITRAAMLVRKGELSDTLYVHTFNTDADSVSSRIRESATRLGTPLQVADLASAVSEGRKYDSLSLPAAYNCFQWSLLCSLSLLPAME
jgi:hypothetical protein